MSPIQLMQLVCVISISDSTTGLVGMSGGINAHYMSTVVY